MIKVFLKNNKTITFELGDEKKENELVSRFHHGLDGNTLLNLKNDRGAASRIKVSDIKNMQYLNEGTDKTTKTDTDSPGSPQDSKFKTREEYEKWKEQKVRENKRK